MSVPLSVPWRLLLAVALLCGLLAVGILTAQRVGVRVESLQLAYVGVRESNHDVYLLDVHRRLPVNVTRHPAFDQSPSWSPDGTQIVFESDRDGDLEIFILDVSSGDLRQITDNDAYDYRPIWQADGRTLRFVSDRDGDPDPYELDLVSGRVEPVAQTLILQDQAPIVTADGSHMVLTVFISDNIELYMRRRIDGGMSYARRLTYNDENDYAPVWRP